MVSLEPLQPAMCIHGEKKGVSPPIAMKERLVCRVHCRQCDCTAILQKYTNELDS